MKIELRNLSFYYKQFGSNSNHKPALDHINLSIGHHELVAIVGPSGSGKTTLVQMMNGLLEPDEGHVAIDGEYVRYKGDFANSWRQHVGIVFQFSEMQFFENTVFDEIAYALRNLKMEERDIAARIENVTGLLEFQNDDLLARSPFHLSEGQKRKVAIASILVLEPEVLILDEPTAGLDYSAIKSLKRIIHRIYQQQRSVIVVSHDMDFIAELVQRVIVLSKGHILFDGLKQDFFLEEDLLAESHLELPNIMKVAKELRKDGIQVAYPVFSFQELRDNIRNKI